MRGKRLGNKWAELGWVREDHRLLTSTLARMQARVYKTYRVYQKPVTPCTETGVAGTADVDGQS